MKENQTDRTKIIGASDVSSILGMNPFCTPLQLWAMKTGQIAQTEENERMEWGHRLERVVSDKFAEVHGVKLIARKTRYVHPDMGFFSCELDNIIAGTDELVEIKTINANSWKQWADPDQLPPYVIVQVIAQMGLSKRSKAWVACLCGGQQYIEKEVAFDKELWFMIESKVAQFWKMVEDRTPPSAMIGDDDILLALHPKDDQQIQAVQEMETAVARRQELSQQIKDLTEEKDEIEVKIKECIGDNLGIKTEKYLVKWTPTKSSRLDIDLLKREGLYEKFCYSTETRRLTIKLQKPEGK